MHRAVRGGYARAMDGGQDARGGAPELFALVSQAGGMKPAPVHLWDPPFCGDIDLVIRRDGVWVHEGGPIRRPAMVRLFASVLRLEDDGRHCLVTPTEKLGIRVEDCPFLVTGMEVAGEGRERVIRFETGVGERFAAGRTRLDGDAVAGTGGAPRPVAHVRAGLTGLIARPVFYRLAALAEEAGGRPGVWSRGAFFPLDGGTEEEDAPSREGGRGKAGGLDAGRPDG